MNPSPSRARAPWFLRAFQAAPNTTNGGSRGAFSAGSTGRLTKVNRCMAEGRKRFLEVFAAMYGGAA